MTNHQLSLFLFAGRSVFRTSISSRWRSGSAPQNHMKKRNSTLLRKSKSESRGSAWLEMASLKARCTTGRNSLATSARWILTAFLLFSAPAIKAEDFRRANEQSARMQIPAKKILRAEDFSDLGLPRGSGLEDVEFVVEINPKLSPYVLHLIPNSDTQWSGEPRLVGKIEISRIGSPRLLQTIDVNVVADVSWFTRTFCAKDINFDGYLDIMVVSDHGAKWGSYHQWLFDPESGLFITNRLTQQLDELMANTRDWNPESKTLHLGFLNLDQARIGETYRIDNEGLTLIEIEERLKDCDGNFKEVTSKIIDGKRDGKDTLTLEPCNRLTQNIAGEQVHNYEIRLEAYQSLRLYLETGNIDLVFALIGPQGERLEVRELTGDHDTAEISLVAEISGIYRVEVRTKTGRPAAGLYFIWLREARTIKPQRSVPSSRS